MKTIAAVLCDINKDLQLEELTIPNLGAGQVLVKIAYTGICHSQLNEMKGLKGPDRFLPHTLGHEGSGTIEAVGHGVKKVKVGDLVVLTWIRSSGMDVSSAQYVRTNGTIVNSGAISTFLTKAIVSENRVIKIPGNMPLKEASLLGCAIPTGVGIVFNTAKVSAGASVAIFGLGGIGLSALLACKFAGANTIIAIDVINTKLEYATKLGATHVLNPGKEDILRKIVDITKNNGVDFSIECAGKRESMEIAFQSVSYNKGLCVIAGNLPYGENISISPFDLIKGRRIIGTWGGETDPDRDIPMYADYYLSGKLPIDKLVSCIYGLDDINKSFVDLVKEPGRILIDMAKKVSH